MAEQLRLRCPRTVMHALIAQAPVFNVSGKARNRVCS